MEIDEEVVGFDLQKRTRSHFAHTLDNNTETEFSSMNMSVAAEIMSGEKPIFTAQDCSENGEKPMVSVEDGEKEEAINGDNDILNHLDDSQNGNGGSVLYPSKLQGTNGFSVDQNDADVAVSRLESNGNGEDEEVHVKSNGTTFLNGTDTAIGLKYVESLLDESSSHVNGKFADITATELNKVNEILKSGQNELGPEAAEYDVEGVISKQETHDLYCPNCNSCITKRVILRRRKRKIQEISTGEEIISSDPGQTSKVSGGDRDQIVEPSPEEDIRQDKEAVGALTCFSCFSIFIPTGKGFLFWKSESKPIIVHQQEPSLDTPHQVQPSLSTDAAAGNASQDEETGKSFPMWILTCCEPYKPKRETAQQGKSDKKILQEPKPPMTPPLDSTHPQPEDDDKPQLPSTPTVDGSDPHPADDGPPREMSVNATEEGKTFPSWILTCCQPSKNQTKTEEIEKTDKPMPLDPEPPMTLPLDKPELPAPPPAGSSDPHPTDDSHPIETSFATKEGKTFSSWILACCQPSKNQTKPEPMEETDKPIPLDPEAPMTPPLDSPHRKPADDDKPELPTTTSVNSSHRPIGDGHPTETSVDATEDEGKSFPSWILTCCQSSKNQTKLEQIGKADTPVSSETESPGTLDADISVQPEHDAATTSSINPNRDITPGGILSPSELKPTVTHDSDKPSTPDVESDIGPDADKLFPSEPKVPGAPEAGASAKSELDADEASPSDPESDITTDKDTLSPPESKLSGTPDADAPSSNADAQNQQTIHMPGQKSSHNLTVIPPDVTEPPAIKVKLFVIPGEGTQTNLTENAHGTPPVTGAEPDLEAQSEPLLPSDEHRSRGVSGLDVIKAIVYGGLLETIASLSIISSAAGGDATTLNIVALGLANVFGGLIVLFHNLRDLKNNRRQYEEQLGRSGHFLLHATIAIISYLVFGLMAPVVYGFSFRKSDDKNMKLITLAAASLACIILLSIGKAYARRSSAKDYIKTIFYYASIGVSVSGLGYVSGKLINDALKELGVFDSTSPVNMSVLETGAVKAALSSY